MTFSYQAVVVRQWEVLGMLLKSHCVFIDGAFMVEHLKIPTFFVYG